MDDGSAAPARSPEAARPAATSAAAAPTDDDDVLEGIVVPGDTPPAPPGAPDA